MRKNHYFWLFVATWVLLALLFAARPIQAGRGLPPGHAKRTATVTATQVFLPTVTVTASLAPTLTLTPTPTCTPEPTATASPTPTTSPTGTFTPTPVPTLTPTPNAPPGATGMRGLTYYSTGAYDWQTQKMRDTLTRLKADGGEWLALVPYYWQDSLDTTNIYFDPQHSHTDADIKYVLDYAHALGLKVMLKPHIDLKTSGQYRWQIGTRYDAGEWAAWFTAYQNFIYHHADLARLYGADLFAIGTELDATDQRPEWAGIAQGVRARYAGPLTYAANTGHLETYDWSLVDYIGVDAYFVLTSSYSPTVEQLVQAWAPHQARLQAVSTQYNKFVVFTEIGYTATDGANTRPWASVGGTDLSEQADCYEAFFRAFQGAPYLKGHFWWAVAPWEAFTTSGAAWNPLGKPAEGVLIRWWGTASP